MNFGKTTLVAVRGSLGCGREPRQEVMWTVIHRRNKKQLKWKRRSRSKRF